MASAFLSYLYFQSFYFHLFLQGGFPIAPRAGPEYNGPESNKEESP